MDDGSSNSIFKSLVSDWSLLWGSFKSEDKSDNSLRAESKAPLFESKNAMPDFEPDQWEAIAAELSSQRKLLNQKMESLNKEIELNQAKAETLKLVGGDISEVEARIEHLTNQGSELNEKLIKLDEKITALRKEIHL